MLLSSSFRGLFASGFSVGAPDVGVGAVHKCIHPFSKHSVSVFSQSLADHTEEDQPLAER